MKWKELERRLLAAGCTIENRSKHLRVRDRDGEIVMTLPHNHKAGAADYHRKLRGQLRKLEGGATK